MRHGPGGKGSAYDAGCRCLTCVRENNAKQRKLRALRAEVAAERLDLPHGTISTYRNHGCRCESCKAAQSEANRRRQSRAKQA